MTEYFSVSVFGMHSSTSIILFSTAKLVYSRLGWKYVWLRARFWSFQRLLYRRIGVMRNAFSALRTALMKSEMMLMWILHPGYSIEKNCKCVWRRQCMVSRGSSNTVASGGRLPNNCDVCKGETLWWMQWIWCCSLAPRFKSLIYLHNIRNKQISLLQSGARSLSGHRAGKQSDFIQLPLCVPAATPDSLSQPRQLSVQPLLVPFTHSNCCLFFFFYHSC